MQIKQSIIDHGICFSVEGPLTGTKHSTVELFERISDAIKKVPENIVLDIAGATYVDTFSIGLLIGILLKCKEKKINLTIENVPKQIKFVLETIKMRKVFPELYK